MRRTLWMACLSLAALLAGAGTAEAQCNEKCTVIRDERAVVVGFGCVQDAESNALCQATSRSCRVTFCSTTLLKDDRGAVLASLSRCGNGGEARPVVLASARSDKPSRKPLAEGEAPARTAMAAPAAVTRVLKD